MPGSCHQQAVHTKSTNARHITEQPVTCGTYYQLLLERTGTHYAMRTVMVFVRQSESNRRRITGNRVGKIKVPSIESPSLRNPSTTSSPCGGSSTDSRPLATRRNLRVLMSECSPNACAFASPSYQTKTCPFRLLQLPSTPARERNQGCDVGLVKWVGLLCPGKSRAC